MKGTVPQCTGFRVYERLNQMRSVRRLGQGSISFRSRIPAEKWQRSSDNSIFMEFFNRGATAVRLHPVCPFSFARSLLKSIVALLSSSHNAHHLFGCLSFYLFSKLSCCWPCCFFDTIVETTICKQNVSKLPRSATLITTLYDFFFRILFATTCLSLLQRTLFIGGKEQQELQHKAWAKRGGRMSLWYVFAPSVCTTLMLFFQKINAKEMCVVLWQCLFFLLFSTTFSQYDCCLRCLQSLEDKNFVERISFCLVALAPVICALILNQSTGL